MRDVILTGGGRLNGTELQTSSSASNRSEECTLTATAGLCWGPSEHDDGDDLDPTNKKTGLQLKAKIPLNQNDSPIYTRTWFSDIPCESWNWHNLSMVLYSISLGFSKGKVLMPKLSLKSPKIGIVPPPRDSTDMHKKFLRFSVSGGEVGGYLSAR